MITQNEGGLWNEFSSYHDHITLITVRNGVTSCPGDRTSDYCNNSPLMCTNESTQWKGAVSVMVLGSGYPPVTIERFLWIWYINKYYDKERSLSNGDTYPISNDLISR